MFQFLFKYPLSVFTKGSFVLLAAWPRWALVVGIAAAAALLGYFLWAKRKQLRPSLAGWRAVVLWALQSALLAVLLMMLWQPAVSVAALRAQQNIVAVVVDSSRSMALQDAGEAREEVARKLLDGGLLKNLRGRFQVRLYGLGAGVARVENTAGVEGSGRVDANRKRAAAVGGRSSHAAIGRGGPDQRRRG